MKFTYTLIIGIIYIAVGMFLMNWGWNFHQDIVKSYNCLSCSAFQKECPIGYDTEENRRCQDSLEWPFKISLGISFFGIVIAIMPFMVLFGEYYEYLKSRKEKNVNFNKMQRM